MKILIEDAAYDAESLGKFTLFDLLEMKKQTGIDFDTLQKRLAEMEKMSEPSDILGSEEHLRAFGAFIWLLRRRAGEHLTFEEALDFPLESLQFQVEEGDEAAAPDPQ